MSLSAETQRSIPEYHIREPSVVPNFMRTIKESAQTLGASRAVGAAFLKANIQVCVEGAESGAADPNRGTLLLGDHRNRLEKWPLMAWVGATTEKDCHFMSKPFSLQARLLHALGDAASELTLPVVPRSMARDRRGKLDKDMYWRVKNRRSLPLTSEIRQKNQQVIQRASDVLNENGLVSIFPTGGTEDALVTPWQRGVGSIVQSVAERSPDNVDVTNFRFDNFSRQALIRSLWLADRGVEPAPQKITLRLGSPTPVGELVRMAGNSGTILDPSVLAEVLQERYQSDFA